MTKRFFLLDFLRNSASVDFGVLLSRLFDSFCRGLYRLCILPLQKESKIGQNNPQNRRSLGFGRSLLFATPIFLLAIEPIDLEISAQDKKKTGIFKLSEKEKGFLQAWIENYYEKRSEPLAASTKKTPKPSLSENLNNGSYIVLTDGTVWNIRPEDTVITQSWITVTEIIITPSGDAQYPYKLTNSLTGSSVLAKKATKIPSKNP